MSESASTAAHLEPVPSSSLSDTGAIGERHISAVRTREPESSGVTPLFAKSSGAEFGYAPLAPPSAQPPFRRELLQQFEGTIIEVTDTEFTARMKDLTAVPPTDEVISFDLDEILEHDRVQIGAVFYWNMGWTHSIYGTRASYSEFVFRNLPSLSKKGRDTLANGSPEFDDLFEL